MPPTEKNHAAIVEALNRFTEDRSESADGLLKLLDARYLAPVIHLKCSACNDDYSKRCDECRRQYQCRGFKGEGGCGRWCRKADIAYAVFRPDGRCPVCHGIVPPEAAPLFNPPGNVRALAEATDALRLRLSENGENDMVYVALGRVVETLNALASAMETT